MPANSLMRVFWVAVAALAGALTFTGCATWQGPRIDPSGERLLVWPNEPPPTLVGPAVPAPAAPAPAVAGPAVPIAAPAPALPATPLPFGNVQAPPVYSDPAPPPVAPTAAVIPPGPAVPGGVAPSLPPSTLTPAVPIVTPTAGAAMGPPVPCGHEFVRLTPHQFVAPVGNEVLLKAGAVSADGLLMPGERIEWSVARTGVGQFSDMGRGSVGQLYAYLEAPNKIDDWTAVGRTAFLPVTMDANTGDPAGEVRVDRGESWVTVASCAEGTTQVTAFAPNQTEFNQATATIYWVDAQWIFPPSVVAECGRPHVLTTSVMRRTDGAPLPGWIVRYTVGGGASLGYEGGNTVDVPTDATGRASVEVNPTGAGGGVTNVGVAIVRPQTIGPNSLPRMELGRSAAAITWSANAPPSTVPGAPSVPAGVPGSPPPTFTPPPAMPIPAVSPSPQLPQSQVSPPPAMPSGQYPTPASSPPNTFAAPSQPTGRPKLELSLRPTGSGQVAVGEDVEFELTVTNRGDGIARHIVIVDRFDEGLRHIRDTRNEHKLEYREMRDLGPNESETIKPTFRVIDAGQRCHDVTVTADNGVEAAPARACVTAIQATLNLTITGPRRGVVGENADFNAVVRNVGPIAATHVEVLLRCDAVFLPVAAPQGIEPQSDPQSVLLRIDRLEPGERRPIPLQARCRGPSNNGCVKAFVTADGGVNLAEQACVEILPAQSGAAPGGAAAPQ